MQGPKVHRKHQKFPGDREACGLRFCEHKVCVMLEVVIT